MLVGSDDGIIRPHLATEPKLPWVQGEAGTQVVVQRDLEDLARSQKQGDRPEITSVRPRAFALVQGKDPGLVPLGGYLKPALKGGHNWEEELGHVVRGQGVELIWEVVQARGLAARQGFEDAS